MQITDQIVKEHGFTDEEYQKLLAIMGREPNITELGIFSVMWSEHCSYKSTRFHLKNLHTKEPWVVCGPGENAGVVDIGDGKVAIFKMESHNHPSFIEPYQGAATGVGGIMRDVFTMGARPVAVLDSLFFGDVNHPKTKHLINGVVAGVGGYGNCVGVPNIGGATQFHKSFNGNILVNAMCVGIAESDKVFYSAASQIGSTVVYVGAKTGRDGIHGATMASAEFDDDSAEKRPTVQVGDPFTEKLLIEACLELMAKDAIIAIQDMGAAGLTSSAVEMTAKGGTGIEIDLDKVPMREEGMSAYEIMLSESQERMLMVIKPEKEAEAKAIFKKWELDFAVIGQITDSERLILKKDGGVVADMPVAPLSDEAPLYERPYKISEVANEEVSIDWSGFDIEAALHKIIASADIADKSSLYEQYDSQVMNDTLRKQGVGSGIVRIHDSQKALAVTTNCTPRYIEADPYMGAMQAVVESYRNLIVTGAKPLAITNCLNFGNPQKPKIMAQIVESIRGITDSCKALHYPVVSGNVSLYNETNGEAIQPCPNIGAIGLIDNLSDIPQISFAEEGLDILLIGETKNHLGRSILLREMFGKEAGNAPEVDLALEAKNAAFVTSLIKGKMLATVNDLGDGGLLTTIVKMSFANKISASLFDNNPEFLFAEDQARYVIATDQADEIINLAAKADVHVMKIGKTQLGNLSIAGNDIRIAALQESFSKTIAELFVS